MVMVIVRYSHSKSRSQIMICANTRHLYTPWSNGMSIIMVQWMVYRHGPMECSLASNSLLFPNAGDLEPLPQRTTPTPPTSLHHNHTVAGPQTTLDRITVSRQVNVLNATASSLSTSSPPLLVPGATAVGHRGVTCAQQSYCLNGGRCYFLPDLGQKFCK